MAKEIHKDKIIMRKILALTLIQIALISCKIMCQNSNKIEKINLKVYKNKELALNQLYREEVKDIIIEYGVFKDEIIKNNFIKGSLYQTKKTYYKSNNQSRVQLFL